MAARVKQAQEQADSAKAQIDIAQRQWDNNKALVDQGFISKTALDTSLNNFNAAQANHKAALAAVDMARKTLDDTVLRAPISGVVAQRLAQPGERVGSDGRVIEIVDLSRLELEATLSAADSMNVRVGQEAALQVEGSAKPVRAKVVRINPSAQAGSRSVLAYLAIADAAGLRQGLFAQGTLGRGRRRRAWPCRCRRCAPTSPRPTCRWSRTSRSRTRACEPGARGDAGKEVMVAVKGLASRRRGHQGQRRRAARRHAGEVHQAAEPLTRPHAHVRRCPRGGPASERLGGAACGSPASA